MLNAKFACYGCGALVCDETQKLCDTCSGVADRTTVYPSTPGGFPPASFRTFADSLDYVRQISESKPVSCGIWTCPAGSYRIPKKAKATSVDIRKESYHGYLVRHKANGGKTGIYRCPECAAIIEAPVPMTPGQQWDSLTECLECTELHMKVATMEFIEGRKLPA